MTIRAMAAQYSVSLTFVQRMHHLYKQTGDVQPKQFGGYRRSRLAPCRDDLQARIEKHPSATLQERQRWLFRQQGARWLYRHFMSLIRKVLKLSDKKIVKVFEQNREDVQVVRTAWCQRQSQCAPSRRVFLEETGVTTDRAPRYGRSLVGHRCQGRAPGGHWQSAAFIAGWRVDGLTTPWVVNGSMNAEAFKTYLRSQWVPTLRSNDIVVGDNLCSHKVAGVQEIVEAGGLAWFICHRIHRTLTRLNRFLPN